MIKVLSLLGIGKERGLRVGDILVVDDQILKASNKENSITGEFKVFRDGTHCENMDHTVLSLARVMKSKASVIAEADGLPGQVLMGQPAKIQFSNPHAWSVAT